MSDTSLALTDRAISGLPYADSGQYFVRDVDLAGFAVRVGKRTKTFIAQGDIRADSKRLSLRITVGEFGRMTTREARAEAKQILGKIAKGIDPREPKASSAEPSTNPDDPTLRQAWARYRDAHMARKGRSAGTIENYRDHVERLMAEWLDQPLSALARNPNLVTKRHDAISSENGPYIANGCMRTLRAIYNHARKTARPLPADNPASAIDWNREKRRDTAMGLAELRGWAELLAKFDNPIRREFHLFLLLSGSRPDALKHARIEHLDFRRRLLHIPKPKGGEIKAFDIPLSRAMIRCLIRVLRIGRLQHPTQALEWVFPATSAGGHLIEHKEDRAVLPKWGNDLRQTYRTIGQAAGVGEIDVHLLMNHAVAGVNAGYITRNKLLNDHLRQQQEAISNKIIEAVRGREATSKGGIEQWLFSSARQVLDNVLRRESTPKSESAQAAPRAA